MKKFTANMQAWIEAEALFARLCRGSQVRFPGGSVIRVYYTTRFREGKCLIVLVLPIAPEMLLGNLNRLARDNPGCYISQGCLVVSGVYPELAHGDQKHALELAQQIARKAEDGFGMQAIVFPAKSVRELMPRL
jgi:hypothetical protein